MSDRRQAFGEPRRRLVPEEAGWMWVIGGSALTPGTVHVRDSGNAAGQRSPRGEGFAPYASVRPVS